MRELFRPSPEFGLLRLRIRRVRQQVPQVPCHEGRHGGLNLCRRACFPRGFECLRRYRDQRVAAVEGSGLSPVEELFLRNRAPYLAVGDPANGEAELLELPDDAASRAISGA
jgi:hypothetical protein